MSQPNLLKAHKLHGLDHLRALAITSVFLFHYRLFGHPEWMETVGSFGWTGVDLFFVLSGYLIAGQLFNAIKQGKPIQLREFFLKRFFRIIPAYMVILILYTAFQFLHERGQMAAIWRYLTFTLNFGLDLKDYGTFTHGWSLCIEEQFYLVLPLLILLLTKLKAGKKAVYVLIALFIGGFAVRLWSWYHLVEPNLSSPHFSSVWYKYIYYPTYNRLDGLLIGVSIAGLFTFYPEVKSKVNRYGNLLLVVGITLLVAANFVCEESFSFGASVFGFPLVSLAYGFITAAVVCPTNVFYKMRSWLTEQIATLSYSIYLIHKMMIHVTQTLLQKTGMDINGSLMFLICVASAIAGALLLRHLVERPFLRVRDRVLGKGR